MLPRLPPLVALRAFYALGVTGSVRDAGDILGVSPTVVSRHVHNLQQTLGVAPVRPVGRGLCLTAAGNQFLAGITGPLAAIAEAATHLSRKGRH